MKNTGRKLLYFLLITAGVLVLFCVREHKTASAANLSTIVYLSNGGTDFPPVTTTLNTQITSLPTPTREGYIFLAGTMMRPVPIKPIHPFMPIRT